MIPVSNDFVNELSENYRKPQHIKIIFGFSDVTAFEDNTITTNGEEVFSDVEDIEDSDNLASVNYATFEKHRWVFNSNTDILPDNAPYDRQGFVSEAISDDDGLFDTNPKITMEFTNTHNSIGFTFLFDNLNGEYPSEMKITTYLNNVVVTQTTFTLNSNEFVYEHLFPDHDKIEFEFTKTVIPHRRIRLINMLYGVTKIYKAGDLMDTSTLHKEMSPVSLEMSISNFDFTLDNFSHNYNHDNPDGIMVYLQKKQPIRVYYGIDVDDTTEWVQAGSFYLDSWETPTSNTAKFTGISAYETLGEVFNGIDYDSVNGNNLGEIAETILDYYGFSDYTIYSGVYDIVSYNIPQDLPAREILQLIANASNCVVKITNNDKIKIEPVDYTSTGYVVKNNIIKDKGLSSELTSELRNIKVTITSTDIDSDTKILSRIARLKLDAINTPQSIRLKYENAINVTISVPSNVTIISSDIHTNYTDLVIQSQNRIVYDIIASGNKLIISTSEVTYNINTEGEDLEITNIFIDNKDIANSVANHIATYLNKRNIYTIEFTGSPMTEPGDVILSQSDFTNNLTELVLSNTINYNGALSGTIEGKVLNG